MLTPDQVAAVIVTKGDVDLSPVLDSLLDYAEVVIWDNSTLRDEKTHGRAQGVYLTDSAYIWSQDDDIIHSPENQHAILAAYKPGVLTGCMWPEWSLGAYQQGIEQGYDDLVFPGSGSIADRGIYGDAIASYLAHFPVDDFFRLWCDTIVGIIAPTKQLDIRFEALPCAEDDNRMCNLPNAVRDKTEAINRARWVRDERYVRAIA